MPAEKSSRQPLHAGLVILIATVGRVLQQRLFKAALDQLAILGEPVNRVLEVDLDGDKVTFTLDDLPRALRNLRRAGVGLPSPNLSKSPGGSSRELCTRLAAIDQADDRGHLENVGTV